MSKIAYMVLTSQVDETHTALPFGSFQAYQKFSEIVPNRYQNVAKGHPSVSENVPKS